MTKALSSPPPLRPTLWAGSLLLFLFARPVLACPTGVDCPLADDLSTAVRSSPTTKTAEGPYELLGQHFGSLQEINDWLIAQSQDPNSTVPLEKELRIELAPGTIHQRESTLWTYYNRNQKIVLDGNGAVVSGLTDGRPTPGWFLSYRPSVGTDTTQANPAPANFEMRDLTIRGYESGGLEISPQTAAGKDHWWEGGISAFITGALITNNHFEDLGSKNTPTSQTNWSTQRYGAGGILARGLEKSWITNNTFEDLENGEVNGTTSGPRLIHAIYLRESSSGNTVTGNHFTDVTGDPIRVCNASNDNTFSQNHSRNAGVTTFVSEFYNPGEGEADSVRNTITGNDIGTLYGSKKKAPKFKEKVSKGTRPDLAG